MTPRLRSCSHSALSNTNIEVTVDPSKHAHTNYENTMTSLQNQINAISFDINTVYTRDVVDRMIADITPTSTPTSGKPLLVNSNNILPATSAMAKQLDHNITLNLTGPVTGSVTFTGLENTLNIATTLSIESGTISDMVDTKLAARGYITTIGDGVSTDFAGLGSYDKLRRTVTQVHCVTRLDACFRAEFTFRILEIQSNDFYSGHVKSGRDQAHVN